MMIEHALEACPICGRRGVEKFRPFCSTRCAMLDLGQWLGGGYGVPAQDYDEEDLDLLAEPPDDKGTGTGGNS